jgi:hypothetical protein
MWSFCDHSGMLKSKNVLTTSATVPLMTLRVRYQQYFLRLVHYQSSKCRQTRCHGRVRDKASTTLLRNANLWSAYSLLTTIWVSIWA